MRGKENFVSAGDKVMVISNHVSLLDSLVIKLFLSDDLFYAIDEKAASRWWSRPFVRVLNFCVIDTHNPLSIKKLVDFLLKGNKILIFPEHRLSNTSSLMKIYQSTGLVLDKTDANIVPVYIDGSCYSFFTRIKGLVRRQIFPKITLTVLPPRKMQLSDDLSGQKRRQASVDYLTNLMREARFEAGQFNTTIFRALLRARKVHGGRYLIMEDIKRKPLSYNQFIYRAVLLGRYLRNETVEDQPVGMFLPTSMIATLMIYALHSQGRYPAMLNYGAGKKALLSCLTNADIQHVYTSRTFIKEGGLEDLLEAISHYVEIRYVEDMATQLTLATKFGAYIHYLFVDRLYRGRERKSTAEDIAVVLFTSGSEGLPKGVVLSHKNLLVNCWQIACVIDFTRKDVLLNFLPVFHSFGLTVGSVIPLVGGLRCFQYPSPLHYKIIPELAYDTDATIVFSTNTFLSGYGHQAHPYDFHTLRYVFAGAEPLTEQTEKLWMEKFGIRILQGYGVTETSPVLAANTVLTNRRGSVGRFVPGVDYRLIDVPGITQGKRLQVKGLNIMKGYLVPGQPGKIVPPATEEWGEGWYDTGDIVHVDSDGYVFIRGRAKRFAKIGGEMISLTAVENMIGNAWPDSRHAVISIPDRSKGEQLVLFTEYAEANRKALVAQVKKEGLSELLIPKKIELIEVLPILPSGKIDYVTLMDENNAKK